MSYDPNLKPEPISYYEAQGVSGEGRGKWLTANCPEHGGRSFRFNRDTGAFACMGGCDLRGGDVVAFHTQRYRMSFVEAAKALGAWVDDGKPQKPHKPAPLSPREALAVLAFESTLAAVAAGNVAHGLKLSDVDRFRLLTAAARINRVQEFYS